MAGLSAGAVVAIVANVAVAVLLLLLCAVLLRARRTATHRDPRASTSQRLSSQLDEMRGGGGLATRNSEFPPLAWEPLGRNELGLTLADSALKKKEMRHV
ncbi:unnamed protein product [Lampetra fluviatilis]